jgi:hypothetical protein
MHGALGFFSVQWCFGIAKWRNPHDGSFCAISHELNFNFGAMARFAKKTEDGDTERAP